MFIYIYIHTYIYTYTRVYMLVTLYVYTPSIYVSISIVIYIATSIPSTVYRHKTKVESFMYLLMLMLFHKTLAREQPGLASPSKARLYIWRAMTVHLKGPAACEGMQTSSSCDRDCQGSAGAQGQTRKP